MLCKDVLRAIRLTESQIPAEQIIKSIKIPSPEDGRPLGVTGVWMLEKDGFIYYLIFGSGTPVIQVCMISALIDRLIGRRDGMVDKLCGECINCMSTTTELRRIEIDLEDGGALER